MNISSEIKKYLSHINTDDKHSKSVKKIKLNNYNDITSSLINNYQKYIINLKEQITKINSGNKNKILDNIDYIFEKLENLFDNYINDMKNAYSSQYESILKAYEQKIRILYENIFNLELNKKILEESNKNLCRKEMEYEFLKQKTGIVIHNGKIINNNRKENEIIILRKENSILKDIIEKQKQENKQNAQKNQKEKTEIGQKLFLKVNNFSSKNKLKSKHNYDSLTSRSINNKNIHNHSHPKSNYNFKSDFISALNNSLLKNELNLSFKSLLNFPSSRGLKNDFIRNILDSGRKTKKLSKVKKINNIKIQNINKIKKISPQNVIKKRGIPKMNKNCQSLNKKKSTKKYIQRNIQPRYKSNKYSTVGMPTEREITTTRDHNSHSKKKNNSEYINEKKINLLNSSMVRTINNESKKMINYLNYLSPSSGNLINLIPKIKTPLNLGINDRKISTSFTRRNNTRNINNTNINNNNMIHKCDIKRVLLSKIEKAKLKNLNICKQRNSNVSDSKSKKVKGSNSNSKGKRNINNYIFSNNIINNTTNNTINNGSNKIKQKIINKS